MGKSILTNTQEKVLDLLSQDPTFGKYFYFTGGTALAHYYLQHRLSDDLDFFSKDEIDPIWLNTIAQKIKNKIRARKIDLEQSFNRNLVFFTLPRETLKTEFTYFPMTSIDSPKKIDGLLVDSPVDIAVNKFFAIYQKPSAKHFIDLFLILDKGYLTWENLLKLSRLKFDISIDPIQLGSQLLLSQTLHDEPKMLIPLTDKKWRNYFTQKAKGLKGDIFF